jgi:general secretion pathway protein L
VCERAWLQSALQALDAAGHSVGRIVAECTPALAGNAQVLLSADLEPAQMLLCSAQGVSLLPLLPNTLGLALAQPDLDVFAEPAVMELAQTSFGNRASLQTRAQRLLLAAQSPWNLAQLELSASPGGRMQKRLAAGWQQILHAPQWRPLRWGVLALLLVQVAGLNALAWQQRRSQDQQRAAIQSMLQQTFPEVSLVIDAPAQMQRAVDDLARARGVGSDTDLGRVLSALGVLAPAGTALSAIELTDKRLQLTATGLDAGNAQPLITGLDAQGLRAQLQDGQLTITPKESR